MSDTFPAIDDLIARFEGFGPSQNLATVNNNPGNIQAGSFATAHGSTGAGAGGFASFPDAATGRAAMDSLVGLYAKSGTTLGGLIQHWAPGTAPGNTPAGTNAYSNFVANGLHADPNSFVSDFANTAKSFGQVATDAALASMGPLGALASANTATKDVTGQTLFGLSFTRAVSLLVGLGALIVGLVALSSGKSPAQVVVSGGKTAAKAVAA